MNKLIITGNCGHMPDVIDKGLKVSVSVRNDDKAELWMRVLLFGKIADNCREVLKTGMKVLVEGKLIKSNTGDLSVLADRVEFL